ncbi:MAG: hypothetical protein JOZ81_05765, partial [Chloroflexi bacterium]|nr:hypothetical protein [Chloroflexota bacterium]
MRGLVLASIAAMLALSVFGAPAAVVRAQQVSPGPIILLAQAQRLVDTRLAGGPIPFGTSRCFTISGQRGIPADALGVVLNVTAVDYNWQGFLTLFPNGQPPPATSTLNFTGTSFPGVGLNATANNTIVRIGSSGEICVGSGFIFPPPPLSTTTDVILDAIGYVPSTATAQMPLLTQPQRLVDTRVSGGFIPSGTSRCFPVAGVADIPATAVRVLLNVTAVAGSDGFLPFTWLTIYPHGQPLPATSTVNFVGGYGTLDALANGAIARIGNDGQVC